MRHVYSWQTTLVIIAAFLSAGCSTPIPPTGSSSPSGIAYHYNVQSAGIYGALYCNGDFAGLLVDDEYVQNYGAALKTAPASLHAPLDPFSNLSNPLDSYTIKFKLNGQIMTWPLSTYLASTYWPSQSEDHAVTSEGASDYQSLDRASKATHLTPTPTPAPVKP